MTRSSLQQSQRERAAYQRAEVLGDLMRDHGLFVDDKVSLGVEEVTIAVYESKDAQIENTAFIDVRVEDGAIFVGPIMEQEIGSLKLAARVREIIYKNLGKFLHEGSIW